jgi:hypothetical protein
MDRWNVWKEVRANAMSVPALEQRIAALEEGLKRAPGEACPRCGAYEFRVAGSGPPAGNRPARVSGAREYRMECQVCGFKDRRMIYPSKSS